MAYPDHIRPVEAKICDLILAYAQVKEWKISVHDGEEIAIKGSYDHDAIKAEIAATDETYLIFFDGQTAAQVGMVWLVHGNEEDLIADCSDTPAMIALCDHVEAKMGEGITIITLDGTPESMEALHNAVASAVGEG